MSPRLSYLCLLRNFIIMNKELLELHNKLMNKTNEILINYGIDPFLRDHHYESYGHTNKSPYLVIEKIGKKLQSLKKEEIFAYFDLIKKQRWHGEFAPYECLMFWIFSQFDGDENSLAHTNYALFDEIRNKYDIMY